MHPAVVGDKIPDGALAYLDEHDQLQTPSVHSLAAGKKVILFGTTFTHALGLELDLTEKGLGVRSRRFALVVDNLVANIESVGEFNVSSAEDILSL